MKFLKSTSGNQSLLALVLSCCFLLFLSLWPLRTGTIMTGQAVTLRVISEPTIFYRAHLTVLFTYGDNDSFPVWYVQDVEQVRADVRVANLSYIQAGWYIDMMRQKAFESDPLPLSLPSEKYIEGQRDHLPVNERIDKPVELHRLSSSQDRMTKNIRSMLSGRGDYLNYLPANKFIIDVDSAKVSLTELLRNTLRTGSYLQ